MIDSEKAQNALCALNKVLVIARRMANENVPYNEIADVLDAAEYLPCLMADAEDKTDAFRAQIAHLARRWPLFGLALAAFDDAQLSWPHR
jgi:hypothetical protein